MNIDPHQFFTEFGDMPMAQDVLEAIRLSGHSTEDVITLVGDAEIIELPPTNGFQTFKPGNHLYFTVTFSDGQQCHHTYRSR